MANPTTNFGWVMPTSSSLVTNLPADFNTFGQAVDTSMSELLGGTTGQVLSKTSNTNMDFTWVTPTDQTPLTTKGDLFTFTTVDARLGVGTNGQVLTADSTAATGLAWAAAASVPTSYGFTAGKNKIINGDFGINQRAFTSTTTAGYNFDRWQMGSSGGTVTASTQAFTAGTAPVVGYEGTNFARLVSASQSANSNYAAYWQPIESVRTFANQTVTVSFWAKASTGTPNIGVSMAQSFGSGGSATVVTSPAVQAITTSWVRYSFNVNVPSISGKTIGAGDYLATWIMTSVGTTISGSGYAAVGLQNVTIDIWGVQVEAGSTATAFQTATGTIQGELAACQRYYWRLSSTASASNYGTGTQFTATDAYLYTKHPVVMRSAPTATNSTASLWYVFANGGNKTPSALSYGNLDANAGTAVFTVSGATGGDAVLIQSNSGTLTFIDFSAEL